jgi:hypothetical protein
MITLMVDDSTDTENTVDVCVNVSMEEEGFSAKCVSVAKIIVVAVEMVIPIFDIFEVVKVVIVSVIEVVATVVVTVAERVRDWVIVMDRRMTRTFEDIEVVNTVAVSVETTGTLTVVNELNDRTIVEVLALVVKIVLTINEVKVSVRRIKLVRVTCLVVVEVTVRLEVTIEVMTVVMEQT